MERVDVSRRHDEGNRLLDRDIALLHDHRRRRGDGAASAPTTWTAAWPFRVPARASTIATPPPTAVTVPLLSTRATATLFDDQMMRTVGITFPARSNAVASSPLRSPIRIVTEGGATWTSAIFCADNAPG